MRLHNYNNLIKNLSLHQTNVYNLNKITFNNVQIKLTSSYNTFKGEKSLKFVRLYNLFFYLTGQRPFLKRVTFNYIKKKILKKFILSVSLSKLNRDNIIQYLINHYLYYFQIYYQKGIKFNHFFNNFVVYLDNPQFFIKNYNRYHQKVQFKLFFYVNQENNIVLSNDLVRYLSQIFLVKIKN